MWILIIMIHAGMLSHNDDVATTSVPNFTTEQSCELAGKQFKKLDSTTYQVIKYTCVHN